VNIIGGAIRKGNFILKIIEMINEILCLCGLGIYEENGLQV
jgi:hypothetical protein